MEEGALVGGASACFPIVADRRMPVLAILSLGASTSHVVVTRGLVGFT